jgi:hypothetical protein
MGQGAEIDVPRGTLKIIAKISSKKTVVNY